MLSPYFEALARTPHICPQCHSKLDLKPSPLNPNVAMWECKAGCGWLQAVKAPKEAHVGKIIKFPGKKWCGEGRVEAIQNPILKS